MTAQTQTRTSTRRWIELIRAGWGAALLIAPGTVLTHIHHVRVDTRAIAITRILGARQLAQAALSGNNPSPEVLAMGIWVDGAHAVTGLTLAALDRSRARAALTDTAVAALWAGVGLRDLNQGVATPPQHDRRRDALARLVLRLVPGGDALLGHADRDRSGLRKDERHGSADGVPGHGR